MEINELKDTWLLLDDRLKKQEIFNENIIKEMLYTKADKSLNKLINAELIGLIIVLLVIPVILHCINNKIDLPEYNIFLWAMIPICILLIIWQALKIYKLTRIDFFKAISNNIKHTNGYNIWIKREKMVMILFVPILFLSITYIYAQLNLNYTLRGLMACIGLVTIIFTCWSYKKLYDKNIKSILKSLDELKELKETEQE
ncbi:hypothetical protein JGH11_00630 [Dysgonomonas sp. Marseille-P4677]|uniref:hypothetical protein n=1 Tax=Dysgonomonas sp. Marseille-P4677 TaxID=2364790 RepID=UPI0019149DE7|nr:hypothetical protein [Dysgonomonas sp. Marseille-P4677]MBK5719364.1 hypothetical protein [Dysgonomonas sp. Marseille-P4677]